MLSPLGESFTRLVSGKLPYVLMGNGSNLRVFAQVIVEIIRVRAKKKIVSTC